MTYQIKFAYACDMGKVRANNEDNFWCCHEQLPVENQGLAGIHTGSGTQSDMPVLAVFDGMGGESCGEMAAFLAAEELGRFHQRNKRGMKRNPEGFLRDACRKMNEAVCRYGRENGVRCMGTTLAMTAFGRQSIFACNLGDSRIYQVRNGQAARISTDHVMGNGFFGKAPLTQYLGVEEEHMLLEPSIVEIDYQPEDRYLLCSDGLTDMLTEQEIFDILAHGNTVEETVRELMEKTMEKGGKDNATIILCEVQANEEKPSFVTRLRQRRKEYVKVM